MNVRNVIDFYMLKHLTTPFNKCILTCGDIKLILTESVNNVEATRRILEDIGYDRYNRKFPYDLHVKITHHDYESEIICYKEPKDE